MPEIFSIKPTNEIPYPTEVSGESHYKENLLQICGEYDQEEGYDDDTHAAELILDNENKYDPNAVMVKIDDLQVGFLAKHIAVLYRNRLKELNLLNNPIGIVTASIKGGFSKKGSISDFGVRLAFYPDIFEVETRGEISPTAAVPPVQAPGLAPVSQAASSPGALKPARKITGPMKDIVTFLVIFIVVMCLFFVALAVLTAQSR